MTNGKIKTLVASIPANELRNVIAQLDKFQAIMDGKKVTYKMIGDMAVVK